MDQVGGTRRIGASLGDVVGKAFQHVGDIGGHKTLLLNVLLTPANVLNATSVGVVEPQLLAFEFHGAS